MWDVHDASKPASVTARARIRPRLWEYWKTQYGQSHLWLFDWLYSYRDKLPDDATKFRVISDEMRAFRKEASISAITRSALRTNIAGTSRRGRHVSDEMIPYWLKKHQQLSWFKNWLLRGEKPPHNVTIPTKDQIARCRKAWDYIGLCADVNIAEVTYRTWLDLGLIPDIGWLKWLYGAPPPAGSFVVGDALQTLKAALSLRGVCAAAAVSVNTPARWETAGLRWALDEARGAARRPGPKPEGPPTLSERWNQLDVRTRLHMWKYALAESKAACRKEIALNGARREGFRDELQKSLDQEGDYRRAKTRQSGLVAPRFFIPSPAMIAFRKRAGQVMAEQQIWHFHNLPGFDEWFADWTRPRP